MFFLLLLFFYSDGFPYYLRTDSLTAIFRFITCLSAQNQIRLALIFSLLHTAGNGYEYIQVRFESLILKATSSLFQYWRQALPMLHKGPLVKLLGGEELFRSVPVFSFSDSINMILCQCIWCGVSQLAIFLHKRLRWRTLDNQYHALLKRQMSTLIVKYFRH